MGRTRKFFLYNGLILLMISFFLQYSTLFNYSEIFKTSILFLGMVSIVISYFLKKGKLIIKCIILFLALIIYYFSKQTALFELVILIMAIEKEEVNLVIKFCFKFITFVLCMHILFYFIAFVYDSSSLNTIIRVETNVIRHSFFFSHSNLFGSLCSWNYLTYLYLNKDNLNIKHYIVGLVVILFISFTCDSRTSAAVCLITIFLLIIYKNINKKILTILKQSFCIIGILSFGLLLLYPHSNIVRTLDSPQILHGRIKLGYIAYQYNFISPFGKNLDYFDNINLYTDYGLNNYTIDSTYYKMFFVYGYIFTIGYFIYIFKKSKLIDNNNNFICFIVAYSLTAFMESFAFYPFIFFPIFVLACQKKRDKIKVRR